MEYDPNIDYKSIHLEWIKAHKNFKPKGGLIISSYTGRYLYNTYYEQMEALYKDCYKSHKSGYILLKDDVNHMKCDDNIDEKVELLLGISSTEKYFLTFNFSDDNFEIERIMPAFSRLMDKSYIVKLEAVFEYFGSKSNHPHIHMIVEVKGKDKTFGRFKKLIRQTQLYKLLSADNFFDIKKFGSHHEDYVDGNKKDAKMENVEKDKIWRQQYKLDDIYIKS